VLALVSGLVAVSTGPAAPPAEKLLVRDSTTRPFGSATTRVLLRADSRYGAYGFRVQASPTQTVKLAWLLRCARGKVVSSVKSTITKKTPVELWRRPPISRAQSCYLQAYTRRNAAGRTTITLLARR
jgi:hypothetical protein